MDDTVELSKQPTLPLTWAKGHLPVDLPKKIGRFTIQALLAQGGMSLLYLAKDPLDDKVCCVKILSPHCMDKPEWVERFLRESQIAGLTDHPNIVKILDQGTWDNGLFIAMEFIQGISLRQFILERSLCTSKAVKIILEVASALLHLHSHRVIHRDLKPDNILITQNGRVKVIDFGIAYIEDESLHGSFKEPSGGVIGTPGYMSPEQCQEPKNASYSDDIYSLGVIMYELLTGKISHGKIRPELIPAFILPILKKAIAPKKDRYVDVVDFISDLSLFHKEHRPALIFTKPLEEVEKFKNAGSFFFEADLAIDPNAKFAFIADNTKALIIFPHDTTLDPMLAIAYFQGRFERAPLEVPSPELAIDFVWIHLNLETQVASVRGKGPFLLFYAPAGSLEPQILDISIHPELEFNWNPQDVFHLVSKTEGMAKITEAEIIEISNQRAALAARHLYQIDARLPSMQEPFALSILRLQ